MPEETGRDGSTATWAGSRHEQLRRALEKTPRQRLEAMVSLSDTAEQLASARPVPGEHAGAEVRAPQRDYPENGYHRITLAGCTPTPLASYLKGLGILRLVAEQADPDARGCWQNDQFVLETRLSVEALRDFFLEQYRPTPLLAPWGARSGFYPGSSESGARAVLERIESTEAERLAFFRSAIQEIRDLLRQYSFDKKPEDDQSKLALMRLCRAELSQEVVEWLDACYTLTAEWRRFPPLLGTGGNEGSGSYLTGFGQLVVDCLHDRKCDAALDAALFQTSIPESDSGQVPGQFAPVMAGGPNQGTGFSGGVTTNPWDYLLALEGTLLFSSVSTRRLGSHSAGTASFPFTVEVTGAGNGSTAFADEEGARAEMWAPLWDKPTSILELRNILGEGRVTVGDRAVRAGLDFARAVAQLGVDRGITAFQRYSFVQRYGKNVFAVPLSRIPVRRNPAADLLDDLDTGGWLDRFRRHARRDGANRIASLARNLEDAIFELALRRDDPGPTVRRLLTVLGRIQLHLARSPQAREACRPVPWLSSQWLVRADDGSPEIAIAAALAGLHAGAPDGGPRMRMRSHLAPEYSGRYPGWADDDSHAVTWSPGASAADNLAVVLHRRLLDAAKGELADKPLRPARTAPLADVAAWLAGDVDEPWLADLLPGLMLVRIPPGAQRAPRQEPLPAAYRLLKPLFCTNQQLHRAGLLPPERTLALNADLLRRLEANDVAGALELGRRRRRAAGIATGYRRVAPGISHGRRLLAALMTPISDAALKALLPSASAEVTESASTDNT